MAAIPSKIADKRKLPKDEVQLPKDIDGVFVLIDQAMDTRDNRYSDHAESLLKEICKKPENPEYAFLQEAISLYRKSADNNNGKALCCLGFLYYEGIGVEKNPKVAKEYFQNSSAQNYAPGHSRLSYCFFEEIDFKTAFNLYKKAAEQKHPAAQYMLGYFYHIGLGTQKDLEQATFWYTQAEAQGHIAAITNLGTIFHTKKDFKSAMEKYKTASEAGEPKAFNSLGAMYCNGDGCEPNFLMAYNCYKNAENTAQGCLSLAELILGKEQTVPDKSITSGLNYLIKSELATDNTQETDERRSQVKNGLRPILAKYKIDYE